MYKTTFTNSQPKWCLLRHLLVLVHILPHNSVFLMPHNLKDSSKQMCYEDARKYYQLCCQINFCHGKCLLFGNQAFRVIFYLIGVLGFGGYTELRDSTRHRTDSMATKYFQDSCTLIDEICNNSIPHVPTVCSQIR